MLTQYRAGLSPVALAAGYHAAYEAQMLTSEYLQRLLVGPLSAADDPDEFRVLLLGYEAQTLAATGCFLD